VKFKKLWFSAPLTDETHSLKAPCEILINPHLLINYHPFCICTS